LPQSCNVAASAVTIWGLPYILHIQDNLGIGDSQEKATETMISLREERARVNNNWFAI
jgi:hypothetical protein